MAITHMDNFTIYGGVPANLLNGVYAENTSCTLPGDPDGVSPGQVLRVPQSFGGGNAYAKLRHVLPVLVTTSGQACRMWLAALPSSTEMRPTPFSFKDAGNNFLYMLVVTPTGRLAVRSTFGGANIAETTNPVVTANGWFHLEMKLVISATVGVIEVRVEGVTVITLTGQNTGVTQVAQIEIANDPTPTSASVEMFIKDFVTWDGTGTYNNDFLGSVIVVNLLPTSDVALNWAPSTGTTGYEILDNMPPNDVQFLSAINPPPAAYKAGMSDLPTDVTSVKAIMTMVRVAKTDGGDASLQIGIISDPSGTPTTGLGANRPITTAQTYWRDMFETDPDTTLPWLPGAVNLAQLQMNRTT